MKSKSFWSVVLASMMISGCSLNDSIEMGDHCEGWTAVYNGSEIHCSYDACKKLFSEEIKMGRCPDDFSACTYNDKKEIICRQPCSENDQVLCNDKCMSKKEFANTKKYVEIDGFQYCEDRCPSECHDSCDKKGVCIITPVCEPECSENQECVDGECKSKQPKSDAKACDPECGAGFECVNGKCKVKQPKSGGNGCDSECGEDQECVNGECQDKEVDISGAYIILDATDYELDSGRTQSVKVEYLVNGTHQIGKKLEVASNKTACFTVSDTVITGSEGAEIQLNGVHITTKCKGELIITDPEKHVESVTVPVTVYPLDENGNNLLDRFEKSPKQGTECRKYADCDSSKDAGDGFCDSFIGYKCSTKCTSDDQCINSDYICRSDGRCAPYAFITKWEVQNKNNSLVINTRLDKLNTEIETFNLGCHFTINWGDSENVTEEVTECGIVKHTYSPDIVPKKYTVTIWGQIENFHMCEQDDDSKECLIEFANKNVVLKEVETFGPVGFGRFAFYGTNPDAFSKVDIPDASKLWTLSNAFAFVKGDSAFKYNIGNWDVSQVTDFGSAFWGTSFNSDISKWDTSSVNNMSGTFANTDHFNQDISGWDVSKVTNMNMMFNGAIFFNGDISGWNVSNVTNMSEMFRGASKFTGNIRQWNVQNVTDMNHMFEDAKSFNCDISGWNVSNVTDMESLFNNATEFNQDISGWDVSKVTNMENMFNGSGMSNDNLCMVQCAWQKFKVNIAFSHCTCS